MKHRVRMLCFAPVEERCLLFWAWPLSVCLTVYRHHIRCQILTLALSRARYFCGMPSRLLFLLLLLALLPLLCCFTIPPTLTTDEGSVQQSWSDSQHQPTSQT